MLETKMEKRNPLIKTLLCMILALLMIGCGAAPGGDSLDGANSDLGLPLSGAAEKNVAAWNTFGDSSYSAAKTLFNQTIGSGDATAHDLSEAYAGRGWAEVKLNGSSHGISDFRLALEKNSAQPEARVGLAGALISKGERSDIDEAVTVLEGLSSSAGSFSFIDRYNVGVTNAEAHAMLAYAYFVQGNRAKSDEQISIARDLDSQFTGTPVDQIDEILSFIP